MILRWWILEVAEALAPSLSLFFSASLSSSALIRVTRANYIYLVNESVFQAIHAVSSLLLWYDASTPYSHHVGQHTVLGSRQ